VEWQLDGVFVCFMDDQNRLAGGLVYFVSQKPLFHGMCVSANRLPPIDKLCLMGVRYGRNWDRGFRMLEGHF